MNRLFLALLLPVACAAADTPQVTISAQRDAEWASYRQAYRSASGTEAHLRQRPLIQAHMQLRPIKPGASLQGLHLQLVSASMTQDVPVDAIGRAVLPMLKKAYDEDAVLRLNRQKGLYRFSGRFSIRERDDGVYPLAQLREACEQVIGAQRAAGGRFRLMGKQCAGVRFIYVPGDTAAGVAWRAPGGKSGILPAIDAEPFESGTLGIYKVAIVRFAGLPPDAEIVAARRPLAIGTAYE